MVKRNMHFIKIIENINMCSALWLSETCISQKYVLYYRNLLLILGQNVCTIRIEQKEKNKPKKILPL
jgi:hypothetical protein